MQNVDPVYLIQPVASIAFSVGILMLWYTRKRFSLGVVLFSFVAYAGAIAVKETLQFFTAQAVINMFGYVSLITGLYLGLQTVFFEVGGAYIVAKFTVSRWRLDRGDAQAYGLGLGMWENAGLLGALPLISLASIYLVLSNSLPIAQTVYSSVSGTQPALFYPPAQALQSVVLGTLERFSSLLIHLAFGWLCLVAAVSGKKRFVLAALPMGLVDASVPYAGLVPLWVFESCVFAFSVLCLVVAWRLSRAERGTAESGQEVPPGPPAAGDEGKTFFPAGSGEC